jgi:diaminohydroxyphosphoribosylaminopyrimidine deaminase/5-amino-6-(5-phosphoribosylamino)uracil reductase
MEKANKDSVFMKKVFDLAVKGKGSTSPNPMVGAVIVRDGVIVGEGFHERAGGPHAETLALREAGSDAKGATLYVNLEPCNHHGRTPPCTDALIKAGIRKVICSMEDMNSGVKGGGLKKLTEGGIEVSSGLMAEEAKWLNEIYFKNRIHELPFVTLKIAQSLDGRIATGEGSSKWITGTESRKHVHTLRSEYDAVLVGIGTVIADNPRLTVRDVESVNNPLRVVLDTDLRIPGDSSLLDSSGESETLIFTAVEENEDELPTFLRRDGVSIEFVKRSDGLLDLMEVLKRLFQRGVMSVLVEGGSKVFTSFISDKLVDKLQVFIGPMILGGGKSFPSFEDLGINTMDKAIGLSVVKSRKIGQDLMIVSYPAETEKV